MVNIILGFLICFVIVLIFLIFVLASSIAEKKRKYEVTDKKQIADVLLNEWLNMQFEGETKEENEERKFYTLVDEAAKLKLKVDRKDNPGESL